MKTFTYFESIHIQSLLFYLIVGLIIIGLPFFIKGLEETRYTTFLGIILILFKLVDSLYRIYFEHETPITTLPLNLCNIAIIIAGIYLITRKNILFNLVYFFSFGAVLAVLLPGIDYYYNNLYIYMFMGTHMGELIAIVYAIVNLKARVTKKGLYTSLMVYLILTITVKIFNNIYGTNFMYLNDYILKALSFIKPFYLYVIILTVGFMLSMILFYFLFIYLEKIIKKNKGSK